MTSDTQDDPFNSLLTLEDNFYKEGYDLGVSDGSRAGLTEGRFFGLERGFEKYASMGKLYGRAVIWTGRLPITQDNRLSDGQDDSGADTERILESRGSVKPEVQQSPGRTRAPRLPANMRLEKHIRTLYALAEPDSLSTANDENSVSDFDDRFNRAKGKIKVIENLTDETAPQERLVPSPSSSYGPDPKDVKATRRDGAIEELSGLHARH